MQKQATERPPNNATQLVLFENRLNWRELPEETREIATGLLATICVQILAKQKEEQDDE